MTTKPTPCYCDYCFVRSKKRQKPIRQTRKNHKFEVALQLVRKYVMECDCHYITKEGLAEELRLRDSTVEHALHVLNREGLVSQACHMLPHDSYRSRDGSNGGSSWTRDIYYIREKRNIYTERSNVHGNIDNP